jgi:hypothetical protein
MPAIRPPVTLTTPPNLREEVTRVTFLAAPAAPIPTPAAVQELAANVRQAALVGLQVTLPETPALGEPVPVQCPEAPPEFAWDPCAPLPARAAPVYITHFTQETYLQGVELPAVPVTWTLPLPGFPPAGDSAVLHFGPTLAGAALQRVTARFGASGHYAQSWFVTDVRIGDLEAVRTLAPAEEVEVELRTSVTSRADRSGAAQVQIDETTETTHSEKEIQSVMQAAATDGGWSQSSSSYYRLGLKFLWLNFGGGDSSSEASQQFSRSSSQTMQLLRDTTARAAQALRAQTTVQVRGIRETVVSERNVRRFRNPYQDRSLLLKIFSVLKSYRVSTSRSGLKLCLTFTVGGLDEVAAGLRTFALANRDFLKASLRDAQLRAKLDDALVGLRESAEPTGAGTTALVEQAKRALAILFEDFLSSDPDRLLPLVDGDATHNLELQRLRNSFFARPTHKIEFTFPYAFPPQTVEIEQPLGGDLGIVEAKNKGALDLYMILYVLYQRWLDLRGGPALDDEAVALAAAAAKAIDVWWVSVPPGERSDAYKSSEAEDYAEIFRRLPGFRAYYDDFVAPLVMRRGADEAERAAREARRHLAEQLLEHLHRLSDFYGQAFLHWCARLLGPSLFAAEVQRWLAWAFWEAAIPVPTTLLRALVPPEAVSVRDDTVVVSATYALEVAAALYVALAGAASPLAAELIALLDTIYDPAAAPAPPPTCVDVDVPIEGAYLEPVAGTCKLPEVPVLAPPPVPPPTPVP